jgi:hypothetical protein
MMMATRQLLPLTILSLGGLGVALCVAGIVGAWLVGARLNGTTENVFTQIDRSFAVVQDTVADAGTIVRNAKIASEDIEQGLKNLTKKEVSEHLTLRLEVEEKAGRLASSLRQADHWLEFSQSSVQVVRQALELGNSTGAPVETDPADQLLEELASLRTQLTEATESVERIAARASEAGEEKSLKEGIHDGVRLALRVIATLGSIDSRLQGFAGRLSQAQAKSQDLKTRTQRWIRIATIGMTLLIAWMAAGQVSLCLHGWRRRPGDDG